MAIDDRRRHHQHTLRVSAWRGDQRVAVLTPNPERPVPDRWTVTAEVDALRHLGVRRVVTSALHVHEVAPFLDSDFTVVDQLHLLRHDLRDLPPLAPVRHRRAWIRDRRPVLDLDARAFDDFWTLDATGLDDAVRATQSSRFRVTQQRGEPITGYAITGRSLDRGYLQRLAVDPDRHRAGLGRALVADSLWWLRRTGAVVTLVNTQVVNEAAYALYRNCGFVDEPHGLTVLALDLAPERPAGTDAPGPST